MTIVRFPNCSNSIVGRFAPSPTGPLHFGSLVAAVGSFVLARQAGGRWLLRMEDLDQPRVVPGAADSILRSLEDMGLEWDGEIVWQSQRTERYAEVLEQLRSNGHLFDCGCTRKEILASAPHPGEEGPVYPGLCRQGLPPGRPPRATRLRVDGAETLCFTDGLFGPREQHLETAVGDFVLLRADGVFSYQLAVVVDDIDAGVNQVVRGADLLGSTPRQIYLYACLGAPPPTYLHLPMAIRADGRKISKRDTESTGHGTQHGERLCQLLRFLGQAPPEELRSALPGDVVNWAIENFDLSRVPAESRVPDDSF